MKKILTGGIWQGNLKAHGSSKSQKHFFFKESFSLHGIDTGMEKYTKGIYKGTHKQNSSKMWSQTRKFKR